ncbi:MAG: NUDIX domain-containing protein [Chloroflexota bacterium]
MDTVGCIDLDGIVRAVPKEQVKLRPAVFAIVVHDSRLLVLTLKATGKYHLPGGGVDAGDSLEVALKRELREETGIAVEVDGLVHFSELFFYYNPSGNTYHGLHFYYLCQPRSINLLPDSQVQDGSAGRPRWVPLDKLSAKDFQNDGDAILKYASGQASSRLAT